MYTDKYLKDCFKEESKCFHEKRKRDNMATIFINVGQTSESCNPIIVPVTTPTATVIVYPFDQRFANAIYLDLSFDP